MEALSAATSTYEAARSVVETLRPTVDLLRGLWDEKEALARRKHRLSESQCLCEDEKAAEMTSFQELDAIRGLSGKRTSDVTFNLLDAEAMLRQLAVQSEVVTHGRHLAQQRLVTHTQTASHALHLLVMDAAILTVVDRPLMASASPSSSSSIGVHLDEVTHGSLDPTPMDIIECFSESDDDGHVDSER